MTDNVPAKTSDLEEGIEARWFPAVLKEEFAVDTTLPAITQDERSLILSIIDGEEIKGQSVIGSIIYLSHYIMHPAEVLDKKTGELVDAIRTLLIQPDGPPISFVATGILKSIARIAWKVQHNPPFDPPVKVKLVQRGTGSGGRTYKLMPVD